jgi:hypothetical protein
MSWFQKGADAAAAFQKDEHEAQQKFEAGKRAWRFWVKEGEEARITFVDGGLTKDGFLDVISFKEHRLYRNGSWNNFYVCTMEPEGTCPICEEGDAPSRVAALTVIDHRKIVGKKKKEDGSPVIYQNVPKLFIAKQDTIKLLTSMAQKRGGLQGCTFDVMRVGNRAPSVGSQFDFIDKQPATVLRGQYTTMVEGKKVTLFKPLNYEEEIKYYSAVELRKLGFGTSIVAKGSAVEEEEESIPFDPDADLPD